MTKAGKAGLLFIVLFISLTIFPGAVRGAEYPLWEAGLGLVAFGFPDYRGSDETRYYLLPLPFVVYRGEHLKINRESIRGLFFQREGLELDFSLSGSVPVDSSQNQARKGMPNLYPSLEIGPSLEVKIGEKKGDYKTTLTFPLRSALAVDFPQVYGIGWVFSPRLNLDLYNLGSSKGLNFGMSIGPVFADQAYHDYFYSVGRASAAPGRPAYSAPGGYGGTQLSVGISKYYKRFWVSLFARWDQLNGAVFADSPLYRKNDSLIAGLVFTWIFAESDKKVEADK
jgi:outer membrane scaffolding protein for murein synthesis (MipA/OmpV family)